MKQSDANSDACDHYLQLTPADYHPGDSPTGDSSESLIHHWTSKQSLISQEQRMIREAQPSHLPFEIRWPRLHLIIRS